MHPNSTTPTCSEQRMLLACARTRLSDADVAVIRELAPSVEWARVTALACQHNLAPLLLRSVNVALSGGTVEYRPAGSVRQDLQRIVMHNASQGRRLAGELAGLMELFGRAGIRAVPFKGAVLAASAYRGIGLRPFNDIDLIVHPDDAGPTARLLAERGFPDWGVATRDLAAHLRCECEHAFVRADGVAVDLHWQLSRRHFPFPLSFDDLWRRAEPCTLWPGGPSVPNLCPADALQVLCMHGTKHAWERLSWVCDIAELLAANPELNWGAVLGQAVELGATRMTLLGLALAADLLDAPLPPDISQAVRADRGIASLAREVRRRLFQPALPQDGLAAAVRQSLFHLRVRNETGQRLRYCLLGAAPTPRDLRSTGLPPALHFLHYLTRPVRLLGKHLSRNAA